MTPLERAAAFERAGRLEEAAALYQDAARGAPDARAWAALGRCLLRLGRWREAAASCQAAAQLAPGDADNLANLGVALDEQGAHGQAADAYRQALGAQPDHAVALYNLGNALRALRRYDEAAASYEGALRVRPDWVEAHANLGMTHARAGRPEAAIASYEQALRLRPDHADAHNGIGLAHQVRGELEQALAHFDRAVAIAPDSPYAHANRAQLWLLQEDFERGWLEYEWRLRVPGHGIAPTAAPRWRGEPLAGRTLLLRAEQGLGDTLNFVRFAPTLAAREARVLLETQSAIEQLVATCPGLEGVVPRGAPLPPHDFETPIASVPLRLGLTTASIPADVPYLAADPALAAAARARIRRDGALNVGIGWQGNPAFPQDAHRSIPLAAFAPLAAVPGVRLYSLQKGFGSEQLATATFPVEDLGSALDPGGGAFTDTAAAIAALDLVIASDSAIVHVAGALGRPVWTLLPLVPDWRWLLGRADTPWYPTMRLYRPRRLGDWREVFDRVARDLAARPG
jgi:tetratricopeptide (TPR) repeat protein